MLTTLQPPARLESRIELLGPPCSRDADILTPEALAFVASLDAAFSGRRADLLERRRTRQAQLDSGTEVLGFLPETQHIRDDASWRVAPIPPSLADRRVEITGPPTRTMTVNALNSGARMWMADFEDATSPTWPNLVEGHAALMDALDRRLDFTSADGKHYALNETIATILVRPRGWHLVDKNVVIDGRPVSASLLDFGLHAFHCAHRQLRNGGVPAFYLPKLESHLEARLWNDVFLFAQDALNIPRGTFRATVLIETLPAAFEMDEILYELREHASGLNAGRWDYIFSMIKVIGLNPANVLPDRSSVTMTSPFMRAYTELLVQTCHKRGAHAIGGMAAAVPAKGNAELFEQALANVTADKAREAADGFDGSWVAHPALVQICDDAFSAVFEQGSTDQLHRTRDDVSVQAADLLAINRTAGTISEAGVRSNIRTALRYLAAWLDGSGAVALDGLMEDAATVEIARSQLWQWRRHHSELDDGRHVNATLLRTAIAEERERIRLESGDQESTSQERAAELLCELVLCRDLARFFTTVAYARWIGGR
jgi:malate synthase